jgi:hypothetical protein
MLKVAQNPQTSELSTLKVSAAFTTGIDEEH